MLHITGSEFNKKLWIGLAVTFPLFAVEFLRFGVKSLSFHVAIPMLIMLMLILFGSLVFLAEGRSVRFRISNYGLEVVFAILIILFLFYHLFAFAWTKNITWGIHEIVKLGIGVVFLCGVFALFPREKKFLDKFWIIIIWSTTFLLLFLIYQYAFIFKSPFLGNNLLQESKAGKNQLTWYIVFIFPYAATYFWSSRKRIVCAIPVFILLVSLVYAGSRGAMVSTAFGILSLVVATGTKFSFKSILKYRRYAYGAILLCIMILWILNKYTSLENLYVIGRFTNFFNPELYSNQVRFEIIKEIWNLISSSPIFGVGLTNTIYYINNVSHNDYILVLSDFGIVGELMFLGILTILGAISLAKSNNDASWVLVGTRASTIAVIASMLFINAYTTALFWIFMGLVLIANKIEGDPNKEGVVSNVEHGIGNISLSVNSRGGLL